VCCLRKISVAGALYTTIAVSVISTSSFADVMTFTDKASISPSSPFVQIGWRVYPHRHHRWPAGWYNGSASFGCGIHAFWTYGSGRCVHGTAYSTCGNCDDSTDFGSGDGGMVGF
jgi:hypothetical protein